MKIYIYSKLKDGAWGGGNQFLKALRAELLAKGFYTDSISKADVLLFNSYQDCLALMWSWLKNTKKTKKIVYRLGPVFYLHRGYKWKIVDLFVILVANLFSDLVIFQSTWSYNQALKLGFKKNKRYVIIHNAVDNKIFFKETSTTKEKTDKVNLIYTSWSTNQNKGFSYLKFLDDNLDFSRFTLKFVGNSPIQFKNIEIIKPIPSSLLADRLRRSDIFISPTKDDACSNAILEALACNLPVIALDSGANPELISQGGSLFFDNDSLLRMIDTVSANISHYRSRIKARTIGIACDEYLIAMNKLYDSINH